MHGTERLSPNSLSGMEFWLGQFIGVGLSVQDAYATASAFATFVVGSVQFNLGVDWPALLDSIEARITPRRSD
jgi:TetR/AcrR family transcriptional regulator, tetracycline repressor protein